MTRESSRRVTAVIDPPGSVVIETKLHPPELFAEYVSRPRLVEQLDAAATRPLTVVTAPTGYGKSTLLAAWCLQATQARRCAWLSLDESDNDPVVLWTYALQALRRLEPGRFGDQLRAADAWSESPAGRAAFIAERALVARYGARSGAE
jgi:LuxR family maltose regulon positive regulatory protein